MALVFSSQTKTKYELVFVIGMNVTLSSQFGATLNEYLVDGLYDETKLAGTDQELSPWMEVDLGESRCIAAVRTFQTATSEMAS